MKVVLDTNVLLAAFGTRGLCEAVMTVCLEAHEIFISEHILSEVKANLSAKFGLPAKQSAEAIRFLREHCAMVTPAQVPASACRDADDLAVIGTALSAGAQVLVTGDKDLLSVQNWSGIKFLTPRQFYESLTKA